MRIINVISQTDAYILIRDLNLKPRTAGTIDVDTLLLSELKSLRNLYLANDIIISEIDFNYIFAKIESLSGGSGGGDAPVKSVNTEIGDVVLDASKIKVSKGHSIEEEFGQLSPVAYSGSYLDLSNRPTGTGSSGPFTVTPWNPYKFGQVDVPVLPGNASTLFEDGHVSVAPLQSVELIDYDFGYANSVNDIVVTNGVDGSDTIIQYNVNADLGFYRGVSIDNFSNIKLTPLDSFTHPANEDLALVLYLFIVQVEEGQNISNISFQDIQSSSSNVIRIGYSGLYLNEPSDSTIIGLSINGGGNSFNDEALISGNFDLTKCSIDNNVLSFANGRRTINLIEYGFSPDKKYSAALVTYIDSSSFSVKDPFRIAVSNYQSPLSLVGKLPETGVVRIHKDAGISFNMLPSDNSSNYFSALFHQEQGHIIYQTPYDSVNGYPDHTDVDG